MLDRTKLKKVGTKHVRAVIDEEYKELLIGKLLLLGYRYEESTHTERIVKPYTPSSVNTWRSVMWHNKKNQTYWRIQTKNVHDILTYWSKPHE